jgi:thiol-disulfide isomerase/thioredoxin
MSESAFSESSAAEREAFAEPAAGGRGWRVWLLIGLALVAIGLIAVARRSRSKAAFDLTGGVHHPAVGTKLTTFQLEPLTGDAASVSAESLAGKVTLVNFWGPWCGACIVEFPHLMELEKHFHEEPGFQFFSISTNADPRDEVGLAANTEAFLKRQGADFPTYRDPLAQTTIAFVQTAKLEAFGYPTTVLLDRSAAIRGLWVGFSPGDQREMRTAIEQTLKDR